MKRTRENVYRLIVIVCLLALATGCVGLKPAESAKKPVYRVHVERDVMVPMRDGVKMATDIYFPIGLPKAPVVLVRTPYSKGSSLLGGNIGKKFAQRGFIFVYQDVRGRYGSGGEFYPFLNDGQDGQDAIAWIQAQPWYGGKLGTWGASYLGTTQWFECPGQDISAMHLTVTSPNLKEVLYTNGELHLMTVYTWGMLMGEHKMNMKLIPKIGRLNEYFYTLPLSQADDRAGRDVDYFNDSLDPLVILQKYDAVNFDNRYREVKAPAIFVAGWYDMFLGPQLHDFMRLTQEGAGAAKESILVVGPWGHGPAGDGTVSYGPTADQDEMAGDEQSLAWFDFWLRGEADGVKAWPKVRIFVMGENKWRDEAEWPLARTQSTKYFLHSGGKANTRSGDGTLSTAPPTAAEPADRFTYDPLKPVPTLGGNNLGLSLGAYNQAKTEDRDDVLCYTTPVLTADVEVTGFIEAVLFAASDAKDTDFTVKLVDVLPDGRPVNIQDGIVRAMYRDNNPRQPTPLTPGAIEEYHLDLWATSNVFLAGHRIRVEVSSSNFPRFNRNLNTGEPVPLAVQTVSAQQTIAHDPAHPSHILLPIIPRGNGAGN